MKQYRVTGTMSTYIDDVYSTLAIDETVQAHSAQAAILICEEKTPDDADWIDDPKVSETLASLERSALADWNAGKPTASPLALAQARGEL